MFGAGLTHRLTSRIVLTLLIFSTTSAIAQELPKAPHTEIFTLTPTVGPFTEPGIAVNPGNPQQVVAVYQDNVHAAYSTDAGHTWKPAEGADPKNYRISGDVSVAFDNQGHAFLCYIAFDKLGTFNYWARGATRNGIFVRRSLDGGKTWEADHIPVAEQPTARGNSLRRQAVHRRRQHPKPLCGQSLRRLDALEIGGLADGAFPFDGPRENMVDAD